MRKFGLFLILSVLSIGIHAQELTEQEAQAKEDSIFNLKLSGSSHYAEAAVDLIMEDDSKVSVARQQSLLLLQTHVIEIFSKCLNMKNQDVQEIYELIEEKAYEIDLKRGDLYRVCKYIAKDALKGWLGNKKLKPLAPEDSLILFGPKEKKVLLPVNPEPPVIVVLDPPKPVPAKPDTVTPTPPSPVPDVVVPAFCKKLIEKGNKKELEAFLEDGDLYSELMYGTIDDMQYISKCYVVIIEKATEKIIGVLDKGESARINFMTKGMDYYGKYDKEKYELIFVQQL